jgi:phosphatidylglycerol---prolipoprotein diacylglyceryl transferase
LIAARIWYMATNWSEVRGDVWGAIFSGAGFVFYGGFLVSFILVFIMAKRDKLPLTSFMDALGPTLCIGYAVGRLGCQLSGDGDYGIATSSIFGMSFAQGVVPTPPGVLVFPTPLYESFITLVVLRTLLFVEDLPGWQRPLKRFGLYLFLISLERFFIEFLRVNPKGAFGLSEAQVIAACLSVVGAALLSGVFYSKRAATFSSDRSSVEV